ncbi:transcription factor bHLH18 [Medicago truncatula]|uniref:transcription factor bHLH18 n=1 Tax=Medicago truncatula TaxID=3880 RepID=UPI000D2F4636|nr:transcription factor bHLH18 [Medicago truncatula]
MEENSWGNWSYQLHHDSLPLSSSKADHGSNSRKTRSASETLDHIITERNRRRELTRKFIELSAFIPGLKKTDKVHVLGEAVKYVAQLQERVKELEEDIKKKGAGSLITITRSHLLDDNDTAMGEMNTKECYRHNETFPELELQILHLSITTTNVLPFGNTLNITIIAQMGDKYKLTVEDLVKKLRVVATLQACDDVQQ